MIGLLCAFSLTTRAAEVRIAETEKAPADETASQDATKKKVSVTVFQNGQPLPGAIVLISRSNVGTVTGKEGTAQISAALRRLPDPESPRLRQIRRREF